MTYDLYLMSLASSDSSDAHASRKSFARAGDVAGVERGHGAVVRRFEGGQGDAALAMPS